MRKREIGAFAMNPAKHLFYNGFSIRCRGAGCVGHSAVQFTFWRRSGGLARGLRVEKPFVR